MKFTSHNFEVCISIHLGLVVSCHRSLSFGCICQFKPILLFDFAGDPIPRATTRHFPNYAHLVTSDDGEEWSNWHCWYYSIICSIVVTMLKNDLVGYCVFFSRREFAISLPSGSPVHVLSLFLFFFFKISFYTIDINSTFHIFSKCSNHKAIKTCIIVLLRCRFHTQSIFLVYGQR